MNASLLKCVVKIRRTAGRGFQAVRQRMQSGGVQNAAEKGRLKRNNLEAIKGRLEAL